MSQQEIKSMGFKDVLEILERALQSPKGIRVAFASRTAAVAQRSRMNYARKLHRKMSVDVYPIGHEMRGLSPYDELIISLPPRGTSEEATLYIQPRRLVAVQVEEIP